LDKTNGKSEKNTFQTPHSPTPVRSAEQDKTVGEAAEFKNSFQS